MPEDQELMVLNAAGEMVELRTNRKPETVLAEAAMVSKALAKYAHEHQLYKQIGPSKHLQVEGWQMCGAMYRVATKLIEDRYIDLGNGVRGYEATAAAVYVPTGTEVGRATAMCLSDEENWGLRPKYEWKEGQGGRRVKQQVGMVAVPLQQLRSMAQTRAQSKVLSGLFKWVAKIGGFAGTPAEEMTGNESGEDTPPSEPQRKQSQGNGGSSGGDVISEAQGKRLFAIAKQNGFDNDRYGAFLKQFGYERTTDIKKSDYERMVAEVQRGDGA
jgi:hypothetical protein